MSHVRNQISNFLGLRKLSTMPPKGVKRKYSDRLKNLGSHANPKVSY